MHLMSQRRQRFQRMVFDAWKLEPSELVSVVRNRDGLTPLARVAALRALIGRASLEVTKGATYITRRGYVRQHYRV